jgi:hypothetical protein
VLSEISDEVDHVSDAFEVAAVDAICVGEDQAGDGGAGVFHRRT